ncbi:hypothetical protein HPB49_015947 [Dermacentor silvarum]|uniref:Uncharacterized protein n=1 Tax=Dermacentor silvarum TaxID=543639 RepID=A0ACB8DED0_DERSI|nr:hypothetical protein HPB49_015947 [Dermacentor silvarum]
MLRPVRTVERIVMMTVHRQYGGIEKATSHRLDQKSNEEAYVDDPGPIRFYVENNGEGYPKENVPEGDYPTIVNRSDGSRGLVVQEYWFGKFLGFLQVNFDNEGQVVNWTGNPILLNSSVEQNQGMLDLIECYKNNVTRAISEVIGHSKVKLEQSDSICRLRECNLGNLIADGFFAYYADKESSEAEFWSDVNGALFNGGAVRAPIPQAGEHFAPNKKNSERTARL